MVIIDRRLWASHEIVESRLPAMWRAVARHRWVVVIGGVIAALRLPSFVEPQWYSDAGVYADIGWALNHGARLYIDVWDNKPPGIYWLGEFLIGHLPTAIALALASTLFIALGALCVAAIGRRLGGGQVATTATLSYVVVASLPSLDGNLFNAELVGATCVALAMAIVLRSTASSWSLVGAGALVGLALLFKAVFAADVVVVMGVPAIAGMAQGRRLLAASNGRAAFAILTGCSLVVFAAGLSLLSQGALGAAIAVVIRSDINYVATYGSGGIGGLAGTLVTAVRILIAIGAGVGISAALLRQRRLGASVLAWWLGWDVAAAMVSGRGFPHYVQQAEPVLCVSLALAIFTLWRRHRHTPLLAAATVVAAAFSCQVVLWMPSVEIALAGGHGLPGVRDDGVAIGQLPIYYFDGYRRLVEPSAAPKFEALFPTDLTRQRSAVNAVDRYSRPGDRVFVWGWIPWVYTLSNRAPAGRYVALNSAYHVDPSAQATLLGDLEAHPPVVLVVEAHPAPRALIDFLGRHRYQLVATGVGQDEYWVLSQAGRPHVCSKLPPARVSELSV